MSALAPLRYPPFRYLAAGRFVTMLGNSVAPIALAFAVLDATGSVRDLGLVVGARSLMNVVFLLFGGVVADRLPRERVMVAAALLAAATQGAAAALVLAGAATVALLVALSAVNGVVTAFAFPAGGALTPQTVPVELIRPANALNRLGMNAAMIAGASVGGILVAAAGPGWGLAVDAGTFALAAAAFSRVRVPPPPARAAGTALRDLREGWREFTGRTWLRVVVLEFAFLNFVYAGAIGVLGPAIADHTIGRRGWGFVLAAETVGMVLGALIALRLRVARLLRLGVICIAGEIPLFLVLAAVPEVAAVIAAAFLAGVALEQFTLAWETSVQRYVPAERLARVYSLDALGSFIAIPLGQVVAGPAAVAWGSGPTLVAGAGITALTVGGMLASRDVRTLRSAPEDLDKPPSPSPPQLTKVSGGE